MHTSKIIQLIIVLFIIFILIHHFCLNNIDGYIDGYIDDYIDDNIKNSNTQLQEGFYQEPNYKKDIKESLNKLKQTRKKLFNLTKKSQKKRDYTQPYLKQIKEKLNEQLETMNNTRKLTQENQNKTLEKIKGKITYFKNYITNNVPDEKFNSVKSLQNGTKMSIIKVPNEKSYLVKIGSKDNKDGCISLLPNGDYNIEECDETDKKQKFKLNEILNRQYYKKNLEPGILSNKSIEEDVLYPFHMIKSSYNNNCLQNFNNHISVEPCQTKKSHKWNISKEHIYCSREE
jgi:hypothetical protein